MKGFVEEIQKPPTAVGQVNLPFGEAQKPQTAIEPVKKRLRKCTRLAQHLND
ncbi:hypothetical protein SNF32_02665 [Enterococcus mundtii]|nr:hypothetical protein [Enterococcus mundtii]